MVRRATPPESARAGDVDAPERAARLRGRYVDFRAANRHAGPGPRSGSEALVDAFAALAAEEFADWVVVDVMDVDGATVRAQLVAGPRSGDGDPLDVVPGLAGVVDRVIASGVTEAWPTSGSDARAVVVGLRVKDRAFGAVGFVLRPGRAPYGASDVVAAEEAAWGLASMIERRLLLDESRQALRATQRMARQLHQLFAATMNVSGARDEAEVAAAVVQSARRVFDADVAVIDLDDGGVAAWIGRGMARATPGLRDDLTVPPGSGERALAAGEWLVAGVGGGAPGHRGVLAVRRRASGFSSEDVEIATLLAQAASAALESRALARGVERSEARLRALVEAAPIGILEASTDGSPRWWNHAAERVLGWPAPGSAVVPEVPAALARAIDDLAAEARVGGGPALRDLVDVEVRGRVRDLTTSAALVALPEQADPTLMVLIDDVTDHRQLKAEVAHAQQMELRGQVASSVAHDFNNLITLITGYSEILERSLGDDDLAEMVRDIQATASRASRLTAQLQSIGRAEELEPVDLVPADVIRANAEVIERVVGRDVELELALEDDAGVVRVDAAQFEQMILNLAVNARDAMPDGGSLRVVVGRAQVTAERAGELGIVPGPYVAVTVADTGVGMDEETMAHCFDAFFTTKGPLRGTGLGLASARRLVDASGGAITVRSAPGVGTTFEALFPLTREAVVVELSSAAPTPTRGFATVLVAEDDDGLRRLMAQVLSRNGYEVLTGATGEEALAIAERYEGPIDLLVSDVVLGGMTGAELACALQGRRAGMRALLTSGTADASVLEGLVPGTGAFLPKPFRPSALIEGVHDLLTRRN